MNTVYIGNTGPTILGDIWVALSENGLVAVDFPTGRDEFTNRLLQRYPVVEFTPEKVQAVILQIREYIAGERRQFELVIDWSVLNEFQRKVLSATFAIPYGQTRSYKEIAVEVGSPKGARAVGGAEASNPMPLILPCHRVLGQDGKLHGYGAGMGTETKSWLIQHEKTVYSG